MKKVNYTTLPKMMNVLGSNELNQVYFTVENNDKIYEQLKPILGLDLPILGVSPEFGLGNFCLEENNKEKIYSVYIIDRMSRFNETKWNNIVDAIEALALLYLENGLIENTNEITNIFYNILKINKEESKTPVKKKIKL